MDISVVISPILSSHKMKTDDELEPWLLFLFGRMRVFVLQHRWRILPHFG